MAPDAFAAAVAPLFEGAPGYVRRLADARPFETEDGLFDAARGVAREMPEPEQVELLNAHPRIGADPATVSTQSRAEQGYDAEAGPDESWIADELAALNEAVRGALRIPLRRVRRRPSAGGHHPDPRARPPSRSRRGAPPRRSTTSS